MLLAEQRVGWGGECVCECVCVVVGVVTGGGEGSDGIFTSSCSWEACVCVRACMVGGAGGAVVTGSGEGSNDISTSSCFWGCGGPRVTTVGQLE